MKFTVGEMLEMKNRERCNRSHPPALKRTLNGRLIDMMRDIELHIAFGEPSPEEETILLHMLETIADCHAELNEKWEELK